MIKYESVINKLQSLKEEVLTDGIAGQSFCVKLIDGAVNSIVRYTQLDNEWIGSVLSGNPNVIKTFPSSLTPEDIIEHLFQRYDIVEEVWNLVVENVIVLVVLILWKNLS